MTMSKIIAVLEHCANDSDELFFVDIDKLDVADPEIKQYHDAVVEGCKKRGSKKNSTGGNVAMNYNSSDRKWRAAIVEPPCNVADRSEIWEGTLDEDNDDE